MSVQNLFDTLSGEAKKLGETLVADAKGELQTLTTKAGRAAAIASLQRVLAQVQPVAASLDPAFGSALSTAISAAPKLEEVNEIASDLAGSK